MVQISDWSGQGEKSTYSSTAYTLRLIHQQHPHTTVSVHQFPKYLQFPHVVEGVTSKTVHVLSQVKKSENHVMFLLSNEETDHYYTSQKMVLSKESASLRLLPLKPRLIEIQKGKDGYGFYLRMEQNTGGKNQVNTQPMTFAIQFIPIQGLQTSFSLTSYWSSRSLHLQVCCKQGYIRKMVST